MTEKKLTKKQSKFINGYLEHGNGAKAARDAGYSAKTARVIASENLTKPIVQEIVEKYVTEEAKNVNLTRETVLRRLKYWMESDDKAASLKACELLGKHLRIFGEQVNVNIKTHEEALREIEELMKDE